MSEPAAAARGRQPLRLPASCWLFVAGSFAFGFALVPLYRVLCQVTGFGDQKQLAAASAAVAGSGRCGRAPSPSSSSATCRRSATGSSAPRRPRCACIRASSTRPSFIARNLTGHDTVAQAVPNIAPGEAVSAASTRPQCFCFSPQNFRRGEERDAAGALLRRPRAAGRHRPRHAQLHLLRHPRHGRRPLARATTQETPMSHGTRTRRLQQVLHAARHARGRSSARWRCSRPCWAWPRWLNDWLGPEVFALGPGAAGGHVHRLVPHRHRREPAGHLQPARRPLVPHGDDVVHLLRGHVLRRLLRRAVLRAHSCRCRGSAARA